MSVGALDAKAPSENTKRCYGHAVYFKENIVLKRFSFGTRIRQAENTELDIFRASSYTKEFRPEFKTFATEHKMILDQLFCVFAALQEKRP